MARDLLLTVARRWGWGDFVTLVLHRRFRRAMRRIGGVT